MAITYYATTKLDVLPEGHQYHGEFPTGNGNNTVHIYSKLHGKVVHLYERNGYDDSDFYAVCFIDGREYVEQYASTRYWSGPCTATLDAPQELVAQWREFKVQQQKELEQKILIEKQREIAELSDKLYRAGLSDLQIQRWIERAPKLNEELVEACNRLLITLNFRSAFREAMRDQIVEWLDYEHPQYNTPLSPKQFDAVRIR